MKRIGWIAVLVLAVGLCPSMAWADIDMSGWSLTAEQTGKVWAPTGGGYGNDGYGASSDTGHWGQASGGYKYSVNHLSVWSSGSQVRVVLSSGTRWKGNGGFVVGDLAIDTNGDGLYDAALLTPDIIHNHSNTDFTYSDAGNPALLVDELTNGNWLDVHYPQFPNAPFAVNDSTLDSSNTWETTEVTFDYDYRAAGAPDPDFYSYTAGDRTDLANKKDYLYAWTFDAAALSGGFSWSQMHVALECGNDGIDLRQVPVPGAAVLGMLGLALVGRKKRGSQ